MRILSTRRIKNPKPIFLIKNDDNSYIIKAWYLDDVESSHGDALVYIFNNDKLIREFIFPSYNIWNIAIHANDIIKSEINDDTIGYDISGVTKLCGKLKKL